MDVSVSVKTLFRAEMSLGESIYTKLNEIYERRTAGAKVYEFLVMGVRAEQEIFEELRLARDKCWDPCLLREEWKRVEEIGISAFNWERERREEAESARRNKEGDR
jgi:hypothetical protein